VQPFILLRAQSWLRAPPKGDCMLTSCLGQQWSRSGVHVLLLLSFRYGAAASLIILMSFPG
jgi:hypothetical protein